MLKSVYLCNLWTRRLLSGLFFICLIGKAQVVSGGRGHSLVVCRDGTTSACGINEDGQLSYNSTDSYRFSPVQVLYQDGSGAPATLRDVVAVAAGYGHSLFLRADGTVWAAGDNEYGQLGDTTTTDRRVAVQVRKPDGTPLTGIRSIAAGYYHSLFLSTDGTVWAVGENHFGQLGIGTSGGYRKECVKVKGPGGTDTLRNIIAISAGGEHSLFLTQEGTVWAVGSNSYGELGDGTFRSKATPVQVIRSDSSPLDNVVSISAGDDHSLFLRRDGTVWATGRNYYGQLGIGVMGLADRNVAVQVMKADSTPLTDVVAIAAGGEHSLFLRRDGTVWAVGYNLWGQLGDSSLTTRSLAVQVRTRNGPLTGVVAIAAGVDFSLFVKSDGSVWATGDGSRGRMGVAEELVPYERTFAAVPTQFCQARLSGGSFLSFVTERGRPPLVSPNPNGGLFTVRLDQGVDRMEVRVLDLTGRVIEVIEGRGDAVTVNLVGRPGVYLVEVRTPKAILTPVKVIVVE